MADVFTELLDDIKKKPFGEIEQITFTSALSAYLSARKYLGEEETRKVLSSIMLWAIAADGAVSGFETEAAKSAFQVVLGREVTFDEVVATLRGGSSGWKDVTSEAARKDAAKWIKNMYYKDEELYTYVVTLCIALVAANGVVTADEERWLRQVLDI